MKCLIIGTLYPSKRRISSDWTDEESFDSRQGQDFYVFLKVCTQALGPIQPPIRWVPWGGGSFPGVKRLGRKADHLPPSNAKFKNE